MNHPLVEILSQRKHGNIQGVFCICTANPIVIEASMDRLKDADSPLILEATANQVNQFGGYTGMKPDDYVEFVRNIAHKTGFPQERLILGGDHLGPLTWTRLTENEAMKNAEVLVATYVEAGFTKIHLDTSMRLASDDPRVPLPTQVIAMRGVRLMEVAEKAFEKRKKTHQESLPPVYIVGSEVPIPGGSQEDEKDGIRITSASDYLSTVEMYRVIMESNRMLHVWERVVAVVVQPGVEFSDGMVHTYDKSAAKPLIESLEKTEPVIFEGHSTDYQTKESLRFMVNDGIAILKVGPALTYALREALFALCSMEDEWVYGSDERSQFKQKLEKLMIERPGDWNKHYHGDEHQLAFARKYSFSDRARYYLPDRYLITAIDRLIENTKDVPLTLLSQFMPVQFRKVRSGELTHHPYAWVKDVVGCIVDDYLYACERSRDQI